MIVSIADSAKPPVTDTTSKQELAKPQVRVSRARGKLAVEVSKAERKPVARGRPGTKTAKILRLLRRPEGASLGELTRATKWQPHSVRGFLSGAVKRKMRLKLSSLQRADGERAYRLLSN
jgi:hypothetical protein